MSAIRHLWAHHRVVLILFLAGLAVSLFFLVRLTVFSLYWADPAHRHQAPEAWMTPGYIAHSWDIDREALVATLGVEPGSGPTLQDIARARGVAVDEVLREVDAFLSKAPSE